MPKRAYDRRLLWTAPNHIVNTRYMVAVAVNVDTVNVGILAVAVGAVVVAVVVAEWNLVNLNQHRLDYCDAST